MCDYCSIEYEGDLDCIVNHEDSDELLVEKCDHRYDMKHYMCPKCEYERCCLNN